MTPIVGGGGGGASALSLLTDVALSSLADKDILRYDIGTGKWVNIASGSDWLSQYLALAGRSGGQVVGATAHSGGTQYDLALEGRLMLGDAIGSLAFTTGRQIDVRFNANNNTVENNFQGSLASLSGAASGFLTAMQIVMSGTAAYSSGSFTAYGLRFISTGFLSNGVTCAQSIGGSFQSSMQENSGSAVGVNNHIGVLGISIGPSTAASAHTATSISALIGQISTRSKNVDDMWGCLIQAYSASSLGNATRVGMFASEAIWTLGANTWQNFYGLLLNNAFSGGTVNNKYGAWIGSNYGKSVIGHPVTVGATSDPIHGLDSQSHLGMKTTGTKVAAYNAASETIIPCSAAGGAFAVNLPTAVGILGRVYIVKKVDATANAVTLTPAGAETIDGAATLVLNVQWQVGRVVSDGANWLTF